MPSLMRWWSAGLLSPSARKAPRSPNGLGACCSTLLDEGYASCCEAVRDADLSGRLGTISTPTLVIAGADDPAAPPDQAESISDSIPNASLEVIPDAAHLANLEKPEAITQAILYHLSPVIREAR